MDYHLLLITLVMTGVGVVVLMIRSGLLSNSPEEIVDDEEKEGHTVSIVTLSFV